MWETRCETIFEEQHCTERLDVWTMEVYQSGGFWCVTAWQVKAHGLVSLPLPNLAAESQQQAKANATRWLIEKLQGELDQLTAGDEASPAPPAVVEDDPDPFELWADQWWEDDSVLPWGED